MPPGIGLRWTICEVSDRGREALRHAEWAAIATAARERVLAAHGVASRSRAGGDPFDLPRRGAGANEERRMWGVIPAAGAGTRIQPLAFSKELLPVGSWSDGEVKRPRAGPIGRRGAA